MPKTYYIEKLAPFSERINDCLVTPFVYQPTPDGVIALCKHYSDKYTIDLNCVDLREAIEAGDNSRHFFTYLQNNPELLNVAEGDARGLILSHGQHHAIPVLVFNNNGKQHIVIFDTTSGPRIQGYFSIAKLFPTAHVYLNSGTRQADGASCITDAVCILKEALQIENLMTLLNKKIIHEHQAFQSNRLFNLSKPNNFNLFHMPEQLLLTAQISKYLTEANADLSVILRGGRTLEEYRKEFSLDVSLLKHEKRESASINSYLFVKAKEHKKILDTYGLEQQNLASGLDLESTLTHAPRISPLVSPSRIGFYAIPDTELASNAQAARAMNFSR